MPPSGFQFKISVSLLVGVQYTILKKRLRIGLNPNRGKGIPVHGWTSLQSDFCAYVRTQIIRLCVSYVFTTTTRYNVPCVLDH